MCIVLYALCSLTPSLVVWLNANRDLSKACRSYLNLYGHLSKLRGLNLFYIFIYAQLLTYFDFLSTIHFSDHLINNPKKFNVGIDDLGAKPCIPHKSLLQWICCKCIAWWHRHSYFWPQRSWRLLEAKNTLRRPKKAWKSWFIKKSI